MPFNVSNITFNDSVMQYSNIQLLMGCHCGNMANYSLRPVIGLSSGLFECKYECTTGFELCRTGFFTSETLAVFHLAPTVGVPRWEVEGSKWDNAVRDICRTHEERWQAGNNQWEVGNNRDWFRPLTALFHLFPDVKTMFSQVPPVDITQSIRLIIFLFNCWSSLMEQQVKFYCQSILGIFIF